MMDLSRLTAEALERLTVDTEPWLSCDDCFEHLDTVIDALVHESRPLPERFRVHLAACAACEEEALSLATLIADDDQLQELEKQLP